MNTDASGTGGNEEAVTPVWSPDGTTVAFIDRSTNLVPGVGGCRHVFLKTIATGAIQVVDTLANGTVSDCGVSNGLAFSPDGTWLLFCKQSNAIMPGSASPADARLFGKNLVDGSLEWFGPDCRTPAWSPDGSMIAFVTTWEACGQVDNGRDDVYVIDRNSPDPLACGQAYRASSDSSGNQPLGPGFMDSDRPQFSPDSTRILFESRSTTLVPGDTNSMSDVFVKDLTNAVTTRVSTSASGAQGDSDSWRAAWSPDGSRIMFESMASNLVAADTNAARDIFVKTLATGAVELVSRTSDGGQSVGDSRAPSWFPDGTRIVWYSSGPDLVPGDDNGRDDVFVKNLQTGFVQVVSCLPSGALGASASTTFDVAPSAVSPDGTRVLIQSASETFTPVDLNGFQYNAFVKVV